jgi:Helix-turn-helix
MGIPKMAQIIDFLFRKTTKITRKTRPRIDLNTKQAYSRHMNKSSIHETGMENSLPHATIESMPIIKKDVSRRLRETFLAMGMTQAQICKETGINPNTLNQYLNPDKNRITPDAIEILYRHYGITADWIYFGNPSGLPDRIRSKLPATAA